MKCGHIVPRQTDIVGHLCEGDYIAECILVDGHRGPHLIKTPEGNFFSWEYDKKCTCEDCLSNEDPCDRCYIHWTVSAEEAEELLKNRV